MFVEQVHRLNAFIFAFVALCFVNLPSTALGHEGSSDEERLIVTVQLDEFRESLGTFNSLGLDILGVDVNQQLADLRVSVSEEQKISSMEGVTVVSSTSESLVSFAPDSQYFNHQEITDQLKRYVRDYPEITELVSIAKGHEGRNVWALKITDNPNSSEVEEPAVLFNGMHHAREVMTAEVIMDAIDYLLTRYQTDQQVRNWVNNNEIWLIPQVNPDGNNRVWSGSPFWRKNVWRGQGVDINRNYPYKWGACNGSSGSRSSDTYRGPSAASEPETKGIMNLVSTIKPVFDISFHSYSELVLYPYGCQGQRAETAQVVDKIGKELARALPTDFGNGFYEPGTPWAILYGVDGGDTDWMYNEEQVIAYVIELNSRRLGFQPAYSWRDPTVKKARASWQLLLNRLEGSGIRGIVKGVTGPLSDYRVEVKGLGDQEKFSDVHKIKADGSFHIVLNPGMFELRVLQDNKVVVGESLIVGSERTDIELAL